MSTVQDAADLADKIRPVARVQQIIVFALVVGLLVFIADALLVRRLGKQDTVSEATQLLSSLAIVVAVPAIAASWWLSQRIVRQSRAAIVQGTAVPSQQPQVNEMTKLLASLGNAGTLCGVFQTQTIISAALLEGAAFFNGVAYLLTGNTISLVVTLLLAATIASKFTNASAPCRLDQRPIATRARGKVVAAIILQKKRGFHEKR